MIHIKDVAKLYPAKESGNGNGAGKSNENGSGSIHALDHISLHVTQGEWLSIMGPSGSGKSTLVNLIGCLDRPSSGEIWLDGQNVAGISAADLNRVRAEKIGFIFQQFHLIPFLTAVENVMLAQYFHSMTDEKEAVEALTRVGLGDRAHHLPSQLSGGEQQRVCIARALINDRRIELHHGKIASQEIFSLADEEQLDEVLEELWVLAEHGEIAEVERMEVHGALPVSLAIEKMIEMELVVSAPHPAQPHEHKPFVNPCHEALKPVSASSGDGTLIVELTPRGRERAGSIIRRHRLAERLFTDSLAMDSESEIEQQACKFEHILSPEATDKICTFLGHPRTCPHGAPIPPGPCCAEPKISKLRETVSPGRKFTRDEMN